MVIKIGFKFSIDFTLCRGVYGNYECKIPHSTEHFVLKKVQSKLNLKNYKTLKNQNGILKAGKLNVWDFSD